MTPEHVPTLPRVLELFATIKAANEELAAIRATCPHPSYTPRWWSYGVGRFHPVCVCDRCRDDLRGCTDEERSALGPLFRRGPIPWEEAKLRPAQEDPTT